MIKLMKFQSNYPNPNDYGNWRACPGVLRADELDLFRRECEEDMTRFSNRLHYCTKTDLAWIVCLHEAGVLDKETSSKVLTGLRRILQSGEFGQGGETSLIPALNNDEDLASLINLGRTMQEPMSRLQLRDQLNDFMAYYLQAMRDIADIVEENAETVMPGHTHFSQANPITLANYLLSVFDNFHRGLEQLDLAYDLINRNTGGCGATSGTVWPVDRHRLTELLGFDQLVEVTYDCEGSQDHTMQLMFTLANICNTLSKVTMDIEIWGLEEVGMIRVDPRFAGVSSMMPQKCHNGDFTENLRNTICDLLGITMSAMVMTKGEPHGDVLAMYRFPQKGIESLACAKFIIRSFATLIRAVNPQKEKMLHHVKQGYSCMTELVVYMVKELGYGGRRSHRICATLTRMARERGIPAPQITGKMLDEAAAQCQEQKPKIDTTTIQKYLDPIEFIKNHNQTGGPAPSETMRMLKQRRQVIITAQECLSNRIDKLKKAEKRLMDNILGITG